MSSWLSGLTGKAEDFLNRLDQSAAEALTKDEAMKKASAVSSNYFGTNAVDMRVSSWETPPSVSKSSSITLLSSQSVPSNLSELNSGKSDVNSSLVSTPIKQSAKFKNITSQSPSRTNKGKDSDDALFEFLNSIDTGNETRKKSPGPVPTSSKHSRQSSVSSTISNILSSLEQADDNASNGVTNGAADLVDVESGNPSPMSRSFTGQDIMSASAEVTDDVPDKVVVEMESAPEEQTDQTTSLQLENRLLRSEIESLNQEMASLVERARASQQDLETAHKKISEYHHLSSNSDQVLREIRAREADIQEALNCKDSQLAVLKVRLEEADSEIMRNKDIIEKLEAENNRVRKDHSESSGIQNQALETMKIRLSELEEMLKREQESYQRSHLDSSGRQSKLEQEQQSLAESLSITQKKFTEEKNKSSELNKQLKTVTLNMEAIKQEMSDYKEKASRILQSKERLIASLRDGSGASGEFSGVSSEEYSAIKTERDMFKDEMQQYKMRVENTRTELQDLELQFQQDRESHREEVDLLQEQLTEEKRLREDSEQDLLKQKRELNYTMEELHKQKTAFQSAIKNREDEIEKLRNQLTTKNLCSTTEDELESRVRTLTESLIQKQTMLEAISTEKNSLGLQLERLEQQYKDVQLSIGRTNSSAIHVSEDDEVRQRLPIFLREVATDHEVTRKMKRAANTIDRFSVRLGIFLRRYPIARVFVIVYMALLHLWVMIVLLTYKPEIHL